MKDNDLILVRMQEGQRQFLELIETIRPDLHRYCARMMGSIIDGEDVVQDALARAYFQLPNLKELPAMRSWLFRISHNLALDRLRRYDRRMGEPLEAAVEIAENRAFEPDNAYARTDAVNAAISRFVELAPAQRSCVILKDVLGCSLEEVSDLLELSVSAVKAALHRGRERLRELAQAQENTSRPPQPSPAAVRYAELFNARDWDAVRAMLIDDVRLNVVTRSIRAGRKDVGVYFTNYAKVDGWRFRPAWLDGKEILAGFHDPHGDRPDYFVELTFDGDRIASIRDFRYVSYIAQEAAVLYWDDRPS